MQPTPFSPNAFDSSNLLVLPIFPNIIKNLLETIDGESADLQKWIRLFGYDPILSARLLAVASSSSVKATPNLQQALEGLSPATVRTLLVTTAIQQPSFPPTSTLSLFWRHSLQCACIIRRLAEITAYHDPEEAYLCGLLHDLGKQVISAHQTTALDEIYTLARIARTPSEVVELEQRRFGVDHCALGAELVETWKLPAEFADAIRFHHLSAGELRGAYSLLRLLHVANLLSQETEPSETVLADAEKLLELRPAALEQTHAAGVREVEQLRAELGIALTGDEAAPVYAPLEQTISELALIDAVRGELNGAEDESALREAVIRSASMLFDLPKAHFFQPDPQNGMLLRNHASTAWPEGFAVDLKGAANAFQRAAQEQQISHSLNQKIPPGVIDRQLARQWSSEGVWCLPLYAGEQLMGVVAAGVSRVQLPRLLARERLWKRFAAAAATALQEKARREARQRRDREERELLEQQHMRVVLHEVSNPLTIVRNSLYVLAAKVGEQAADELRVLQEEMERASRILLRLAERDESVGESGFDLNRMIRDLARVLEEAFCWPRRIRLTLNLAEGLTPLARGRDAIRQILLNLVRNAAEALAEGGCITVTTQDRINLHGRLYTEIAVADNGPGLPKALRTQLFQPVATAKGEGHAGLGLSIVKNLTEALGGQAGCRPNPGGGVVFLVLLPQVEP